MVGALGPPKAIDDLAFCEVIGIDVLGNSIGGIRQFEGSADVIGVEPWLAGIINLHPEGVGLKLKRSKHVHDHSFQSIADRRSEPIAPTLRALI